MSDKKSRGTEYSEVISDVFYKFKTKIELLNKFNNNNTFFITVIHNTETNSRKYSANPTMYATNCAKIPRINLLNNAIIHNKNVVSDGVYYIKDYSNIDGVVHGLLINNILSDIENSLSDLKLITSINTVSITIISKPDSFEILTIHSNIGKESIEKILNELKNNFTKDAV